MYDWINRSSVVFSSKGLRWRDFGFEYSCAVRIVKFSLWIGCNVVLSSLSHKSILSVYGIYRGRRRGSVYLVTEFFDYTLDELIHFQAPLTEVSTTTHFYSQSEIKTILYTLLDILSFIHSKHIVHWFSFHSTFHLAISNPETFSAKKGKLHSATGAVPRPSAFLRSPPHSAIALRSFYSGSNQWILLFGVQQWIFGAGESSQWSSSTTTT